MTDGEKAAYDQALVDLVRAYLKDQERRDLEALRHLDRLERLIDEAFAPAPRRRRLFR